MMDSDVPFSPYIIAYRVINEFGDTRLVPYEFTDGVVLFGNFLAMTSRLVQAQGGFSPNPNGPKWEVFRIDINSTHDRITL
jgi:hypothetical protein